MNLSNPLVDKSAQPKTPQALHFGRTTIVLILIAILSIWFTFTQFIELSGFAILFGKVAVGMAMAHGVDGLVLKGFNTFDELKAGNVAYAIVYFGLLVIIAASVATV